jgi:hypothetical protein
MISKLSNNSVSSRRLRLELRKQLEARKLKKKRLPKRPDRKPRLRKNAKSVKLPPLVELKVVIQLLTLTREPLLNVKDASLKTHPAHLNSTKFVASNLNSKENNS